MSPAWPTASRMTACCQFLFGQQLLAGLKSQHWRSAATVLPVAAPASRHLVGLLWHLF